MTKTIKGGLEVDVDGIRGFLPISQIDLSRVDDAAAYVNQKFKAIVTEVNKREKNLVVLRRELLEQERAEQREKTWATLEEGQIRDGVVRSIKDFGAFVDLGGVDGLLPIGEMSWSASRRLTRWSRPATRSRSRCSRSTGSRASSRSGSSNSPPVPGKPLPRNIRAA